MASQNQLVEGVFAINKPPSITSAECLRQLQSHFNSSTLFAPLLAQERENRRNGYQKKSRGHKSRDPGLQVKLGHGGTLDPLATGVLIVGVGAGTKSLSRFLECSKEYECAVLFGAATDTYDITGKVVARKSAAGVTKEKVRVALEKFKGAIMQVPPVFSALRVNGKRMYEYAREGREMPEVKARELSVESMELVEWLDGQHEFGIPEAEAEEEEKAAARWLLHLDGDAVHRREANGSLKRKRGGEEAAASADEDVTAAKRSKSSPDTELSDHPETSQTIAESAAKAPAETADPPETSAYPSPSTLRPPAAKLHMTVSSGFYVRSLCHDLGAAVDSLGLMASLVRTRQGPFALGKNVLEYKDLEKGEEVWGRKVKGMLEEWMAENPREPVDPEAKGHVERKGGYKDGKESYRRHNGARWRGGGDRRRRNTSSDEG